jgi:hypothetical protein
MGTHDLGGNTQFIPFLEHNPSALPWARLSEPLNFGEKEQQLLSWPGARIAISNYFSFPFPW